MSNIAISSTIFSYVDRCMQQFLVIFRQLYSFTLTRDYRIVQNFQVRFHEHALKCNLFEKMKFFSSGDRNLNLCFLRTKTSTCCIFTETSSFKVSVLPVRTLVNTWLSVQLKQQLGLQFQIHLC